MEIIKTNLKFKNNTDKMKKVECFILHHSGVTVSQSVETIHNYHQSKGWAGIGYHYYIKKDGSIYEGRPLEMAGSHCPGKNYNSVGICVEGNFDIEHISEKQRESIKYILNHLKAIYGNCEVLGHKEVLSTSCPRSKFSTR